MFTMIEGGLEQGTTMAIEIGILYIYIGIYLWLFCPHKIPRTIKFGKDPSLNSKKSWKVVKGNAKSLSSNNPFK